MSSSAYVRAKQQNTTNTEWQCPQSTGWVSIAGCMSLYVVGCGDCWLVVLIGRGQCHPLHIYHKHRMALPSIDQVGVDS